MSTQAVSVTASHWLRWFPAAAEGPGNRWRLIRFERVDEDGRPVGKAITCMTPGGMPRLFRSEAIAKSCAALVNQDDGL